VRVGFHDVVNHLGTQSVYLLYWYNSTRFTGTKSMPKSKQERLGFQDVVNNFGTQFTCFTGTKVQILTLLRFSVGILQDTRVLTHAYADVC
jgi:hypothetical protein